ncbi:uncharacterized protein ARMOST_02307 [Armillaria ostoyae]|uniref:Uncharacterized protein n=1 Tax=Armillaria ostoyae TaxID=47428 RepID=A0A284QRD8_ARMOS|nr:uncharacterized protein ARMOST_02307 [Armillaria ostoyae]
MAYDSSISRLPLNLTLYPYFHPIDIFKMCRRRHVRNVYLRCGHTINLPEQIVRQRLHIIPLSLRVETTFQDHRPVCAPVGNTFVIPSSIPPTSAGIVPPATGQCNAKATTDKETFHRACTVSLFMRFDIGSNNEPVRAKPCM